MKNKTLVFKSYQEFLDREDKSINGVDEQFSVLCPDFEEMNESNEGCWNCFLCTDCLNCSSCSRCVRCVDCFNCLSCQSCKGCSACEGCTNCSYKENLKDSDPFDDEEDHFWDIMG